MISLEELLSRHSEMTIHLLASAIQQYIHEQWQQVLQQNKEELLRIYDTVGEAAYGTYAQRLFRPVQKQLKQAGILSEPRFPGTLSTSREWGPLEGRERWMWCVMKQEKGAPFGTIVIRFFHDHTQFRVPHRPVVLALEETETHAIVEALSYTSAHFKNAGA
jgi:hypothetical protein